jgi:hypothetical protein
MRKFVMFGLCAMLMAAFVAPALAADDEVKFKFSGEVRTRFEYTENYLDFTNNRDVINYLDDGIDDKFSFWPYRVRFGVEGQIASNVKVYAEFQNAGNFGLSDIYAGSDYGYGVLPNGLFGYGEMGYGGYGPFMPAYPMLTSALDPAYGYTFVNQNDALLYQGYLQLDELFTAKNLSVRIGRQEHVIGTQLLMGDNEFYNGISFDGAHVMWHPEKYQVDGFYYKLNETLATSGDKNLWGLTGNYGMGKKLGDVTAYYIRTQNMSDYSFGYNDYYPVPGMFPANTGLDTYGIRWGRMVKSDQDMKDLPFDWNFEAAFQSGDFGTGTGKTDFGGSLIEAWFGWNFGLGSGRGRVHVGTLMASGQPADEETKYKAFVPLFGNTYAYNRLGDLDLFTTSDINDINLGFTWATKGDKHNFMFAVHSFQLAEDVFLYNPDTENEEAYKNLGTELDLRYTLNMNSKTSFSAGYATLMPGDVLDKILTNYTEGTVTSADSVNRLYAQVRVRF